MNAADDASCYVCGATANHERVLVSVREAMNYCEVSRPTLYRWMHEHRVEWVKLPTGRRRIYLDSLLREPRQYI